MKVYVAAPFGEYVEVLRSCRRLHLNEHEPTASWGVIAAELNGVCEAVPIGDQRRLNNAHLDMHDVRRSDAVIVLVPESGGTGMWVEVGMAIAWGKRVLCVGPALERTIFCALCEVYETPEAALDALNIHKHIAR